MAAWGSAPVDVACTRGAKRNEPEELPTRRGKLDASQPRVSGRARWSPIFPVTRNGSANSIPIPASMKAVKTISGHRRQSRRTRATPASFTGISNCASDAPDAGSPSVLQQMLTSWLTEWVAAAGAS